ncbi:MAG TPA: prephenate dehydratase [Clostridia bacterium]|jgi:prephenate dehydratase|nr:prephenate dehydratase [Clostridia bacterium]HHY05454.1 prephenate dehydratase [Clostridia bacterium]
MPKTLAYLGPEGTFTHQAAQIFTTHYTTDSAYKLLPCPDIPEVMEAVAQGTVEQGIVPAENSIAGTVNITADLLAHELNLFIQGEIVLDITHHLLSFTPDLAQIHTVISHPQALAQCRHFLKNHLPHATILKKESTAEAVRLLKEEKQTGTAAIGSLASHLHYQVPIKYWHIGDFPHNQTRFLLLEKNPLPHPNPQKTSLIVFPQANRPGQLYEILGVFAKYKLNLCKVESRPDKKELGSYLFLIDYESTLPSSKLQPVFLELKKVTISYKNLGSYPVYRYKDKSNH